MKEETLSEAANAFTKSGEINPDDPFQSIIQKAFTFGASWQKEQTEQLQKAQIIHTSYLESQLFKAGEKISKMYTEEEVKILLHKAGNEEAFKYDSGIFYLRNSWFNRHKKK